MINHINRCSVFMKRSIELKNENMFDPCQVNYYLEELKKNTQTTQLPSWDTHMLPIAGTVEG